MEFPLPQYLYSSLLLILTLIHASHCWPEGDRLPTSVCWDMKPKSAVGVSGMEGHLLKAVNDRPGKPQPVPYYIQVHTTAKNYQTDQHITVSVVANQTKGAMFYRGILLQARPVICASNDTMEVVDEAVGSWIVQTLPGKAPHLLATMDCSGTSSKSAVRHRTPAMKINETITWVAPKEPAGHVTFWATIVHEGNDHWTGVHSRLLNDPNGGQPAKCSACAAVYSLVTMFSTVVLSMIYSKVL